MSYYTLKPSKGMYREPAYLAFLAASERGGVLLNDNRTYEADTPAALAKLFVSVPHAGWVITYHASAWFVPLLSELIRAGFSISTYTGAAPAYTLTREGITVHLVDLAGFFGVTLSVMQRYTPSTEVFAIAEVWQKLVDISVEMFGVFPSRTPGATGMKWYKTGLPLTLFPRAKTITRYNYAAVQPSLLYWKRGEYHSAHAYDINASFLAVMRALRYPVRVMPFLDRTPPRSRWIASIKINYTHTAAAYPPPFAMRIKGLVIRPEKIRGGRVRMSYLDMMSAASLGKLEFLEFVEGVCWSVDEEEDLFGGFVDTIETHTTPATKNLIKIISRSLHSKFAQSPIFRSVEVERMKAAQALRKKTVVDIQPFDDETVIASYVRHKRSGFKNYVIPEIEALTLALARHNVLINANTDTIYIDTDSIISTAPRPDLDTGPGFGQWKQDGSGPLAIAGPRAYVLGKKIRLAGAFFTTPGQAIAALRNAARGEASSLEAKESDTILSPGGVRQHMVRPINYPIAEVNGALAYVTQSPTREEKIIFARRIIA